MDESLAISVVIPAFNAAETIGAQLAALSRQEWSGSWEVVIADNGSTDGTASVAAAWKAQLPALRVVPATARRGAAHARNVAAMHAHGDFLLFVDADDMVEPGWLGRMADAARDHALIAGASREVGKGDGDPRAGLGRPNRWSGVAPSDGFLDAAASNNLGVRKQLWSAIGGFRESMVASEDTAFCWDAQLQGFSIHRVPDALVTYTMRSNLRQLWRQQFRWGVAAVQLYTLYRVHGAPRSSTRGGLLRWVGLVAMAPRMLISAADRRDWVGRAARRCGRLSGSLRFRVLFV